MKLLIWHLFAEDERPNPPIILETTDQGGLGWRFFEDPDNPSSGPTMQIVNYASVEAGDLLEVLWEDPDVPVMSKILDVGDERLVNVRIPPARILAAMDGDDVVMNAWYRLKLWSNQTVTSPKIDVRVKLNIPGAPRVDPDHPYENEDLPAPEVAHDIDLVALDEIDVVIRKESNGPAWINMVSGDVVTLYWGDQPWAQPPVTDAQAAAGKPVVITLTKAQLSAAGSGDFKVFYGIRDVVGNWSRRSRVADVSVIGTDALTAPDVRDVDLTNGVIDLSVPKQSDDLYLRVPVYDGCRSGDVVTMTWTGLKSEGVAPAPRILVKVVGNPVPAKNISIPIPLGEAEAIGEGTVTLRYTLERLDGSTAVSRRKTYSITGGSTQKLVAPIIEEAKDAALSPWDAANGAHVLVAAYAFMAAGDVVTVRWNGVTATDTPTRVVQRAEVEAADVGKALRFTVDTLDVDAIAGGVLTLSYTVEQNATPFDSESASFTIGVPAWRLAPPTIPEAVGGSLSPDAAATVRVGSYDGKAMGDRVTFTWKGKFPSGGIETLSGSRDLDGATAQAPVDFPIAADVVARLAGGTVEVTYTVETVSAAGVLRPSRSFGVTVASLLLDLPPPRVTEAAGGWLDPANILTAASVVFDAGYASAATGDLVTMACFGSMTQTSVTNANVLRQGATSVTVTLAKSFVEANRTGLLTISGDVRRDGPPLGIYGNLLVKVGKEALTDPLNIDPDDLLLTTGDLSVRTARDGVKPYRYSSSATTVVQVTNTADGNLRALAPGTAVITVTDAAMPAGAASYKVVVRAAAEPLRFEITTDMELVLGGSPLDGG